MEYTVRKAENRDLPGLLGLYAQARAFMRTHGNPNQWGHTTPKQEVLEEDIQNGDLYVLENETGLHGAFFFKIFQDPTYGEIEGAWHEDREYGVLHRVASDGSGGILKAAVAFGDRFCDYLRMDTHAQNLPMQAALKRRGFQPCGVIHLLNGDPRLAYDRRKVFDKGL